MVVIQKKFLLKLSLGGFPIIFKRTVNTPLSSPGDHGVTFQIVSQGPLASMLKGLGFKGLVFFLGFFFPYFFVVLLPPVVSRLSFVSLGVCWVGKIGNLSYDRGFRCKEPVFPVERNLRR